MARPGSRRLAVVLFLCLVGAVACMTAPPVPPPAGCLGTPGSDVTATVGQPVRISATVALGLCPAFPTDPRDDAPFKTDITVGEVVRLRLLAPLLPVRIDPVSSEVQSLRPEQPETVWEWQVVADEPGVHRLSIVASVVDPDGGETVIENRSVEVRLHAEGTVGYYAGRAWNGVTTFVMNAQGLVAAIAGVASVLGGTWLARRSRSRRSREEEPDVVPDRDRDRSGYL